ncbi:MAG: 5'-nucleotidase C-terminal domain-containing protein [Acidobacteria bacterium]|nr:5'-nucleotidase C-terminal domain-containing protein [Acidobacteriota bacterium]
MVRLAFLLAAICAAAQDLRLSYTSEIDNTPQPYRLYIPPKHPAPAPLVIAMHGTGGDENTLFDAPPYQHVSLKAAADRHGFLVVSPLGRGITEYRGSGEHDVLRVLEEVRRKYPIDPERIYLTGHSMGGTGAAYLAMRHPDLFAAAAPLAAAYSFPWLARNLAALPTLWIGGANDEEFYHRGVAVGVERMRKFGANTVFESLPGEGHNGPVKDFDKVFAWLGKHRRDPHPRRYVFEADTPMHGCAFWTCLTVFSEPGRIATIQADANGGNRVNLALDNVAELTFIPDSTFLDTTKAVPIAVNGNLIWSAPIPLDRQLRITAGWTAALEPIEPRAISWRNHPVGRAPHTLDMMGTQKPLGTWIADAMRAAAKADIALYGGWAYRGLPIPEGTVDIVDLLQCSRPFDQYLVTVQLTGHAIAQILDDNVPHPKKDQPLRVDSPGASRLVQVSGMSYAFDPNQSDGHKIIATSLDPERVYTVALEGQVVERQSMLLAGRFRRLDYRSTEIPLTMALYGYAAKSASIVAPRDERIRQAK